MIDLKRYWWPLVPLAELDVSQPIARTLHGIPLVLFRDSEGKPLPCMTDARTATPRFPAARFIMVRLPAHFTAGAFPLMAAALTYRV